MFAFLYCICFSFFFLGFIFVWFFFFFLFFMVFLCFFFFFFSSRRRHTRLVSDWGSDVCSSDLVQQRLHGPYAPFYYALILCNILTPQLLWFYKMRHNVAVLFIMSIVVNIGMWLERFVIVEIGRASCRERV